jgi:hypothetical protein
MTLSNAESLVPVTKDEMEALNPSTLTGVSKPKSTKKKKSMRTDMIVDDDDNETTPTSKSKKKKKKKATSETNDLDLTTSNTKPKSVKKKKISTSTASTGILSDEEMLNGDEKPKSVKSTIKTKPIQVQQMAPVQKRGGGGPARGRGPSDSFRASGRGHGHGHGRGPTLQVSGRGYYAGNSTTAMRVSGHNPHHRAPTRSQSMGIGGGPPPGGRGTGGLLSSSSAQNPSMRAPGRPSSMVISNHGRGGRGTGRGGERVGGRGPGRSGSSVRSSFNEGSSHGGNGFGHGSSHQPIRPPGRPASILRSNGHGGRGAGAVIVNPDGTIRHVDNQRNSYNLGNGSAHRAMNASGHNFQSHYNNRRTNSSHRMERSNSEESFAIDYDDIEGDFPQENLNGDAVVTGIPGMVENLSKSVRSLMDMSANSGNESSGDRRAGLRPIFSQFNSSTRSILTFDWEDSNEGFCVRTLRYLRLMAPHPNEKPVKKKIRILTWTALVLDLLGAIVAITTYGGVTTCCGEPMMNIAGNFPWEKLITAVT